MLDTTGIRQTFRNVLLGIPTLPGTGDSHNDRVSWENIDFKIPECKKDDPTKSIWMRENYLKGKEIQRSYGYVEQTSIMQYTVYVPSGAGVKDAELLAKAIGDAFKPGSGLTSTGVPGVTAATPSAQSGNPIQIAIEEVDPMVGSEVKLTGVEGVWWATGVRITFRAYGTVN